MLKIFYSSLIIKNQLSIDNFINPLDNYYSFTKNENNNIITINFNNIKKCIQTGKIIPQRDNFFKTLRIYNEIEEEKKLKDIFSKTYKINCYSKIIYGKNIVKIDDIFFDLNKKYISKNLQPRNKYGGIYLEKFLYGRYERNNNFENIILNKSDKPGIICITNSRFNIWKEILNNKNVLVLSNYSNLKKVTYRDINKVDFVLVTFNLLNNTNYKGKFSEYRIDNEITNQSFINIRNDLYKNKNLEWEFEPNLNILDWGTYIIDFTFDEWKKNMNQNLLDFNCETKWVIFNEYLKNKENISLVKDIFDRNMSFFDLENFIISGETFEPKFKVVFNKELLVLKENEKNGYDNYIKDFENIYNKNNLKFEDDQYLQKYCSFPQSKLKINKIFKNLDENQNLKKINKKYMESIQTELNKEKKECKICLDEISDHNIGITECGHLFCFSCIYKNLKYSDNCPCCRSKISYDQIYFVTNNDKKIILDMDLIDELGTKNTSLLMNIKNHKKILIVSNFDDGIEKIKSLLDQLSLNPIITKNEKKLEDNNIFLSNYNEDFMNMKNKINPEIVIFMEPYYSKDFEIKLFDITKSMNNPILKFLVIKDSIEEQFINNCNFFNENQY